MGDKGPYIKYVGGGEREGEGVGGADSFSGGHEIY